MAKNEITIRYSILIAGSREYVWDYTQNYDNRSIWDSSVLEATVLQNTPNRIVQLKMRGNTKVTFVYKLDDRPQKTSLAVKEIISPIIENAGGSWLYEEQNGSTLWSQTNTIVFKQSLLFKLLLPFLKFAFSMWMKKAMQKAKQKIEKANQINR